MKAVIIFIVSIVMFSSFTTADELRIGEYDNTGLIIFSSDTYGPFFMVNGFEFNEESCGYLQPETTEEIEITLITKDGKRWKAVFTEEENV